MSINHQNFIFFFAKTVTPDCVKNTAEPTNCENHVSHNVVEPVAQVNDEKPIELDVKKIETMPPLLKTLSEYSQEEEQR
jgi:hypothetical protein